MEENKRKQRIIKEEDLSSEFINCLKNERVIVRYIKKQMGIITNPKHIFYGGMAENAFRAFTVPVNAISGAYINPLTRRELEYLEEIMSLEHNALSIHTKVNNFWENFKVTLYKGDNIFDLSDPMDYIRYKVLLINTDYIASSLEELSNRPKATYQFVIISENEEAKEATKEMDNTMAAYMKYGKIEDDKDTLRFILEIMEGKPISDTIKSDVLKSGINKFIKANPKMFLQIANDELIPSKVLIRKSVSAGLIRKRGDFYYLAENNTPLCEDDKDPTITNAAKYLNFPKNQELKLMLEAKLKSI